MRMAVTLLGLAMVLLSTTALAEVPGLMNYQGTLTDSSGMALDTTVSMTFSIKTDSVAGATVWSETQPSVTISNGRFIVLLKSVQAIPDTVFNEPERWLSVQVGGDSELTPRQRIAAEGYALRSADDGDWITSGAVLVGANRLELDPGFVRGNLRFQVDQLSLYGGTAGIALRDAGGPPK